MPAVATENPVPFPFIKPVNDVPIDIAGVEEAFDTVPVIPLTDVTDTVVTVPEVGFDKTPAEKDKPEPIVISSAGPVPAVVRPNIFIEVIVNPFTEAYALGATGVYPKLAAAAPAAKSELLIDASKILLPSTC